LIGLPIGSIGFPNRKGWPKIEIERFRLAVEDAAYLYNMWLENVRGDSSAAASVCVIRPVHFYLSILLLKAILFYETIYTVYERLPTLYKPEAAGA
jgi:hypothetical protein